MRIWRDPSNSHDQQTLAQAVRNLELRSGSQTLEVLTELVLLKRPSKVKGFWCNWKLKSFGLVFAVERTNLLNIAFDIIARK